MYAFKRFFVYILFLLLFHPSAVLFPQVNHRFGLVCSYWTVFDDNTFKNYQMAGDVVSQPKADLFYSRETGKGALRADYEGTLALFREYAGRRFQNHALALGGSRVMNDSGTASLHWGLNAAGRLNQPDYAYYDYRSYSAYANVRYSGWKGGSLGAGVSGESRDFRELPQFNYAEGRAYVQPTLTLRTRTTLIGQFQFGYKKFTEPVVSEQEMQETVYRTIEIPGRGAGRGRENKETLVEPVTVTRTVASTSPGKNVVQFTGLVRVAQSVFSGTGLAIQGLMRRNPKQDGRFLSYQDGGYEDEDVLFDDPYSYESDEWSVEWTQLLPWKLTAKAGFEKKNKRYVQTAYDAEGYSMEGALRRDNRRGLWITLKKTVRVRGLSPYPVFTLSYLAAKNSSNDAYYDYINHVWSAGMSFGF